jgi:hypothetical protein
MAGLRQKFVVSFLNLELNFGGKFGPTPYKRKNISGF